MMEKLKHGMRQVLSAGFLLLIGMVGVALLLFVLKTIGIVIAIAAILVCPLGLWVAFEIKKAARKAKKLLETAEGRAFLHDLSEVSSCLVQRLGVHLPGEHVISFGSSGGARVQSPTGQVVAVDAEHLVKLGAAFRLLVEKHFPGGKSEITQGPDLAIPLITSRPAHETLRAEMPYLEMLDRLAPRGARHD